MPEEKDPFPALSRAKHLSELLCEGELDELAVTPEDEEAASELQQTLLHLLQAVPPDEWPQLEAKRAAIVEQEHSDEIQLLGLTAP